MVSIAESGIDLFGGALPSLDELKELARCVNSSESNVIEFSESIKANRRNSLAAGIGLTILGRWEESAENLKEARDCREKFIYLGYAQSRMGQIDKAVKSFDRAEKKQADPLMVALEKADAYRWCGQFDKAAEVLGGCTNFENVSAEYHFQTGRFCDSQGDYGKAIENYLKAVELDSQHVRALFHLAYASDLRGDDAAAVDFYKQTLEIAPVYINALLNLAVLYEDETQYKKALSCVNVVLKNHPNHKRAILFKKDIESSQVMIYDEDREKRMDRQHQILEIPISDFELSVRSRNCLNKMNIYTIGDLLRISEAELLSYKNFGETSLTEIKKILDSKGLDLGMDMEDSASILDEEGEEFDETKEELLTKSVEDMNLSVRARRALGRLNLRTIGEVVSKTEAELLGCKNFGVTSLNEINERLSGYGLSLRTLE